LYYFPAYIKFDHDAKSFELKFYPSSLTYNESDLNKKIMNQNQLIAPQDRTFDLVFQDDEYKIIRYHKLNAERVTIEYYYDIYSLNDSYLYSIDLLDVLSATENFAAERGQTLIKDSISFRNNICIFATNEDHELYYFDILDIIPDEKE
ncbi:hypothetical protein RZS08_17510, partial [Arthrospira platensis SPKY1]|nr:hypothetical protein [Arthrospira platensis SPKY1]